MKQELLEKTVQLFCQTIFHRVVKPALSEISEQELTDVQLHCLRYVCLHHEPSVGEIASGLSVSNAASAKLIDRLVKKGLLTREEDQQDRRVLKIKLTPNAVKLLERANRVQTTRFFEIIGRMSAEEARHFEEGLGAFLNAALIDASHIDAVCLKCGWDHLAECPGNIKYHQLTGSDKTNV